MREGRPSDTALTIARSVLFWNEDPEISPLIPSGAAEASRWFIEEAWPRFNFDALKNPRYRTFATLLERALIPGISIHYLLRKRWIEEKVRVAIAEGFERVCILAAGLDTLALRLHREFPHVQFVEFDHPATQRVKRAALERHQRPGENLFLQPIDLAHDVIPSVSEGPGGRAAPQSTFSGHPSPRSLAHARDDRSFWIAEGLLMYLEEEAVRSIFRRLARDGKGRFLFTVMDAGRAGKYFMRMRAINLLLHLRGEPFRWHIDEESVHPWLKTVDFRVLDVATPAQLRQRYLAPAVDRRLNPPTGDILFLSEW